MEEKVNAGPADHSIPITAADSDLSHSIKALYVTGAGDVKFTTTKGGLTDTWTVPANFIIPVEMNRVWATGTTATGLHGLY